jgi:hypothetical protein
MSIADLRLVQGLVFEEIRRIVAESIEAKSCLDTGRCARRIARAYPNCGFTPAQIADEIVRAAIPAGVAVEFSRFSGVSAS